MADSPVRGTGSETLTSWKEIAAFLGVSVRTAQYWERLGLPVGRLPGARGRVVAVADDLRAWLELHAANGLPHEEAQAEPRGERKTAAAASHRVLGPNRAVPRRRRVEPSSTAIAKSLVMPMER